MVLKDPKVIRNKYRRRLFSYLPLIKAGLLGLILCVVAYMMVNFVIPGVRLLRDTVGGKVDVLSLVSPKEPQVKQDQGRTNILLLGTGDPNHDGVNLTDTMIVASVDLKTQNLDMVSIPRDIWVGSLNDKVNSAYATGEEKQKGGGLILAKATVSEILNLPLHYAVRLNFSGFKQAIDLVGGITVNVDRVLDDYYYPIEGKENDLCGGNDPDYKCRYEHLHFDAGSAKMDGATALKYVRSRHAEGDEGTDFARSKRQQKVILSLKDKVMSPEILFNPNKIRELLKIFGDNIDTDIKDQEIDDFAKIALKISKNISQGTIRTFILDTGDEIQGKKGLLKNPPVWQYGDAWVLIPEAGENNWKDIQSEVNNFLFGSIVAPSPSPTTTPDP